MSYNELRKGRCSIRGQAYLITTVTHHRAALFTDFRLARQVILQLREHDLERETQTFAFVVMPDHVHWLFALVGNAALPTVIKRFKGSSARRINRVRESTGTVWQPGFHDHALREEERLVDAARYVIMNPVRARLVSGVSEYPHWDARWV